MFYEENDINEFLQCPYCKNRFNDPRFIECGNSFCMQCIELLINYGESGFKCPVCDGYHETPKNGFSKNINLANLCIKKANDISRGILADSLKDGLSEFNVNLAELKADHKLGVDKIKIYCDKLRNDVQLSSEELIESIKRHNMELIEKVNEFEMNSLLNFNNENKHNLMNQRLDAFINDMHAFEVKWVNYLKQPKINDTELRAALSELQEHSWQIYKDKHNLMESLFNDNTRRFEKNPKKINSDIIGNVRNSIYENQLNSLKSHDLAQFIPGRIRKVSIKLLSNETICVAYSTHEDLVNTNIIIFDVNLERVLFRTRVDSCDSEMFHLAEVSNSIILCLSDILDSNHSIVCKYDHSLNDLSEMELDFNAISMNVYKNKIFFLSGITERHSNCHIYVYDEHFNRINKLGQDTDFYIPFFLPEIISSVQVCEDYFVLLDNIEENQISIMDKNTGEWNFSIPLNKSSKFF